jgi:hypothetical protein
VEAVYVQISEIDDGRDNWPFSDTIMIIGTVTLETLETMLAELEPDELGTADDFGLPSALPLETRQEIRMVCGTDV